ncbi:hypothetical protein XarbCFBP8132_20755 [Xanthomonas arboricola]|nr:hypothetical protein XarbCFBP8132_20755 [Xanthomonas arboricola]
MLDRIWWNWYTALDDVQILVFSCDVIEQSICVSLYGANCGVAFSGGPFIKVSEVIKAISDSFVRQMISLALELVESFD